MPLSKEELLSPRYKITADYPQNNFTVGYIINYPTNSMCLHFDKYPHLFQKLPWYAERKIEDMPEYIKCITECRIPENTILKANWETYDSYPSIVAHRGLRPDFWIEAKHFIPSTQTEYDQFLKNKS